MSLLDAMHINPTQPSPILALGNPHLLGMDMSKAAQYWAIEVPIGQRDHKSGAKKRKQPEIGAS
jgi:DNA (cytosine-5)-methyltransferase 1